MMLWHTSESPTPRLDAFCWAVVAISGTVVVGWVVTLVQILVDGGGAMKVIPISSYPVEVEHAEQTRYGFIPLEELKKKYSPVHQDEDFRDEQYHREGVENSKLVLTWVLVASVMFWAGVFWAGVIWFVARHVGKH